MNGFPKKSTTNLHENNSINGEIKIKNLICDLYIISMADHFLSNSMGGFTQLARECFNNKYIIQNKFHTL